MRQIKIERSITNRESYVIEKYLQEIQRTKLLSPKEEVRLAIRIKKGCQQSLHVLVEANLRFVVSVAKQYQYQGLSLPDLVNEGNLGLIKAAQHFDETRGFKFISYAVWWIRQSILQALGEHSRIVRLPQNKVGLTARIKKESLRLLHEHEREPSVEELAEALGISEKEVEKGLRHYESHRHTSIDNTIQEDSESTFLDIIENENAEQADRELVHHESLRVELARYIRKLSQKEQEVLYCFFGIGIEHPMSLGDIGARMGYCPERVRQIKDRAIKRLREYKILSLKKYLG